MAAKTKDNSFLVCPYTVIQDSNEGAPWMFNQFKTSAAKEGGAKPIVIYVEVEALWTKGLADYTIKGYEERIQIERKSVSDLYQSCTHRRGNFEAEIQRLNTRCEYASVIIEGSWRQIEAGLPDSKIEPASIRGTILSWQLQYPKVHWNLCDTRAYAEMTAFRLLNYFWLRQPGHKDWF